MRSAITTPGLLDLFQHWNAGKPRREQMRPFNFFMVARVIPFVRDELTGENWIAPLGQKFALMAPLETDPERWDGLKATNRYEPGSRYRITTRKNPYLLQAHRDLLPIRTLRDVFCDYRDSREPKSLGPDGQPGHSSTVGLLARRHIKPGSFVTIGKEMNAHEEQLASLRTEQDSLNTYRRPGEDPLWQLVVRVLSAWAVAETAAGAGVAERTVEKARADKLTDTDRRARDSREKLTKYARGRAAAELRKAGNGLWKVSHEALLATYLDHHERHCAHCGKPLTGKQRKYCSTAHERAAVEARRRQRNKQANP